MELQALVFYFLAAVITIAGFLVVVSPNPIFSSLFLALTMVSLGFMYYLLEAHFIAAVQLIVYAGAVMVLFVMVLMLFDLKRESEAFSGGALAKIVRIGSVTLFGALVYRVIKRGMIDLHSMYDAATPVAAAPTVKDLSTKLFVDYVFAFEILGVLLLLIAIGVVAVSRIKGGTHARV